MVKTYPGGQTALAGLEKRLTGSVPDDSAIPNPVRKSVRWMLAGAGITSVLALFWVVVAIADKNALTNASGKKLTNGQFAGGVAEIFVEFLVPAVVWVVMARYNRAGQNWARIVASLLCALNTYDSYRLVNSLSGGMTLTVIDIVYIVLTLASWVVGVIAIALLWRAESTAYIKARTAARTSA
jgi:hypothetical protein